MGPGDRSRLGRSKQEGAGNACSRRNHEHEEDPHEEPSSNRGLGSDRRLRDGWRGRFWRVFAKGGTSIRGGE